MTPDTRLAELWAMLPDPFSESWREIDSSTLRGARLREGLEIFASVIWHLELASTLGPISETKAITHRKQTRASEGTVAWGKWLAGRTTVASMMQPSALSINYAFSTPPNSVSLYALQATLVGDAAIRLGGLREIIWPLADTVPLDVFTPSRHLEALLVRIEEPKILSILLVIAFRDAYMHAEATSDTGKRLSEFRSRLHYDYSLHDIYEACISVWQQLYDSCVDGT